MTGNFAETPTAKTISVSGLTDTSLENFQRAIEAEIKRRKDGTTEEETAKRLAFRYALHECEIAAYGGNRSPWSSTDGLTVQQARFLSAIIDRFELKPALLGDQALGLTV
jgi:hypothetical protein